MNSAEFSNMDFDIDFQINTDGPFSSDAGHHFIYALEQTIEQFYRVPPMNAEQNVPISGYDLSLCFRACEAGAHSRDPVMMYLWAEALLWAHQGLCHCCSSPESRDGFAAFSFPCISGFFRNMQFGLMSASQFYEHSPMVWYERSAASGYVPAMYWLSWCCLTGLGTTPDTARAQYWLRKAAACPFPASLDLKELDIFTREALHLADEALQADLEAAFDTDTAACAKPDWETYRAASILLYDLGALFGSTSAAARERTAVPEDRLLHHQEFLKMRLEKALWKIWCRMKGARTSPAVLLSQLARVREALHELPARGQKRYQQLIQLLQEECLP